MILFIKFAYLQAPTPWSKLVLCQLNDVLELVGRLFLRMLVFNDLNMSNITDFGTIIHIWAFLRRP